MPSQTPREIDDLLAEQLIDSRSIPQLQALGIVVDG